MLPVTVFRRIPFGTFEGDYIVGDNDGQICILTAEMKRDAGIDLFCGGPKVIDIGKHIRKISVAYAVRGSWGFGQETVEMNTAIIEDRYLLRCGFSRELQMWFISGEVQLAQ